MGIAMSSGGHRAYVTTGRAGTLAVIDLDRNVVVRSIAVGGRPWGVAVGPDGIVYTANGPTRELVVIDPDAGRVLARVGAGASPWGVVVAP